ncbi:hypothetical protein BXZ70DRAFT_1005229 [Cristinia sonorae]|uniref:Borealin N-terminal domain-containing protein n=1 Tax=Cristinia sonorae TaxID=1940300 RepID=A0A8K0UVN0_9AGAR|nr:hypothetical protein BXZ70DRAFT_1005229 [Cristinia sonorae]
MATSQPTHKKYTAEEKAQLLANLDLEVAHRTRQFESWLADALENFRIHQEGLILRVPRLVRDVTMREFAKYNGDVQECLKGIQRERLGGEAAMTTTIDKSTRKRKWVESQETAVAGGEDVGESSKGSKTARMAVATPKKKNVPFPAPGTAGRSRLPITKTPSTARINPSMQQRMASPSPHKSNANKGVLFPKLGPGSRPASPSKQPPSPHKNQPQSRVPSTSTFNPAITTTSHPRWPRRDESMLSVNGSPLANPYQLGMGFAGWLSANPDMPATDGNLKNPQQPHTHKRTNSIIVRSASGSHTHTRTNSQAGSSLQASQLSSTSQTHSRSNSSHTNGFVPTRNKTPPDDAQNNRDNDPKTPMRPSLSLPTPAAMVAVPTKDGHVLEFDPLNTTPAEIDALEGITDSAKKQARADIGRLVMQAVELWKIT